MMTTAVRDSLRFLAEVIGHPVETSASPAVFLKAAMQRLACLILGHHVPEMTGPELADAPTGHCRSRLRGWHQLGD